MIVRARGGRWIPLDIFAAAQFFHAFSWIALGVLALRGYAPGTIPFLGWVHAVALGWLSLAALAVLFHVIHAFADVAWRWEIAARTSTRAFAVAVLVLIIGFFLTSTALIEWGAIGTLLALVGYMIPASATLLIAFRSDRRRASIARALMLTLGFFLVTAILGTLFALALSGRISSVVLARWPYVHAVIGISAWLSLLVFGVSTRTIRAITGIPSRAPMLHIIVGTLFAAGALVALSTILKMSSIAIWVSAACLSAGAFLYAGDMGDILRRRTLPNPIPQAFFGAADFWLVIATCLGIGTVLGYPWQSTFLYVALIGWLGQAVNAHVFHIGVRLLTTFLRGDDDETRPWTLVNAPLGWSACASFQLAVGIGAVGIAQSRAAWIVIASALGFLGWTLTIASGIRIYAAIVAARPALNFGGGSRDAQVDRAGAEGDTE